MIRFVKDDPEELYGSTHFRFYEQEEQFDAPNAAYASIRSPESSDNDGRDGDEQGSEDRGFVWPWQLADGPYEERNDIPADAVIVVKPPSNPAHIPRRPIRCIYYPDTKYALCGYDDQDFRAEPFGPLRRYSTHKEAEQALFERYGYGDVPGYVQRHNPLAGEYSKAYEGDFRYRWQAFINGNDQRGWAIRTQGPEPDPAFFYLFPDGHEAVRDWHDAW